MSMQSLREPLLPKAIPFQNFNQDLVYLSKTHYPPEFNLAQADKVIDLDTLEGLSKKIGAHHEKHMAIFNHDIAEFSNKANWAVLVGIISLLALGIIAAGVLPAVLAPAALTALVWTIYGSTFMTCVISLSACSDYWKQWAAAQTAKHHYEHHGLASLTRVWSLKPSEKEVAKSIFSKAFKDHVVAEHIPDQNILKWIHSYQNWLAENSPQACKWRPGFKRSECQRT